MRFGIGGGSRWLRGGASIGRGGVRGGVGIGPFSFTGGSRSRRAARPSPETSTPEPVSDTAFAVGVVLVALLIAAAVTFFAAHLVAVVGLLFVFIGVRIKSSFEKNTGESPPADGFAYVAIRWGWIAALVSAVGTQTWMWYLHDRRVQSVDEFCHEASALTIVFCYPYTMAFGTSIYPWMILNWTSLAVATVLASRVRAPK